MHAVLRAHADSGSGCMATGMSATSHHQDQQRPRAKQEAAEIAGAMAHTHAINTCLGGLQRYLTWKLYAWATFLR